MHRCRIGYPNRFESGPRGLLLVNRGTVLLLRGGSGRRIPAGFQAANKGDLDPIRLQQNAPIPQAVPSSSSITLEIRNPQCKIRNTINIWDFEPETRCWSLTSKMISALEAR